VTATTLGEATIAAAATLRAAGIASPEVDARWLVASAAGTDPRRAPGLVLEDGPATVLALLVARRSAHEPLQLVLGTTAFRTLELRCRPGVFVPRPETEVLAGLAIDAVRAARRADGTPVVVHEPCCGTGAVGLAVASEVTGAVVLVADRSPDAVALTRENRDVLAGEGRLRSPVEVHEGDLLAAFAASSHPDADVIVANPPYLPESDLADLDHEVAAHDPHDALAGGPDGHEVVDRLLADAARRLAPGGTVLLEIDARRAVEAVAVARGAGLVDVVIRRDLTGAERFVLGRRPGAGVPRG
jgi:release factor glutamine methyltransferase